MDPPTIHLRPTAPLAERALLPGDPGRALTLAQTLLSEPRMFNHHRGLWGYTGAARDGQPLTIQSTGMGSPSAAIVLEELICLGLHAAIRVGTCGSLGPPLELGELVVVREALVEDGTSRALGAGPRAQPDARLVAALASSADSLAGRRAVHCGPVVSTDLFYDPDEQRPRRWRAAGALAVEMEAAALFTVGRRHGLPVACVLAVSDEVAGAGAARIADADLLEAAGAMGAVAVAALAR
jgi:DeoD family purine-nucleoside phosphorylase